MEIIEALEDIYTSAYCRLSFDVWYPGYKDDVTKYMQTYHFDDALEQARKEKDDSKIMYVDGCKICRYIDLRECIKIILYFLYSNEVNRDYSVIFALPFEQHKEADRLAYEHTNRMIEKMKFSKEFHSKDYVINIWRIDNESERYLKLHEDLSIEYAINFENEDIKRGYLMLDQELYSQIVKWAIDYVVGYKEYAFMVMGLLTDYSDCFRVNFSPDKLGMSVDSTSFITEYVFEYLEERKVLTKLFTKPELEAFFNEVR